VGSADTIYLVRHAKAGERRTWELDDHDRPLSKAGTRQAKAIAKRLAEKRATSLYSSSYVRCVQTLEPLGLLIGRPVEIDKRLVEDEPFEPVLDLIEEVEDGAVLCSHGDIIPATIVALQRRGMDVRTAADWRKGTIWVLRRKRGRVTQGKVWPPPT
jgi:8-oxo-dGTP diphosphatase